MYIFEYAEEHGFKSLGPKFHQIATDTIQVKRLITFEQVAKVVNLPVEEVQFLNPSYKLGIIPYIKDKNYHLLVSSKEMNDCKEIGELIEKIKNNLKAVR